MAEIVATIYVNTIEIKEIDEPLAILDVRDDLSCKFISVRDNEAVQSTLDSIIGKVSKEEAVLAGSTIHTRPGGSPPVRVANWTNIPSDPLKYASEIVTEFISSGSSARVKYKREPAQTPS